MKTWKLTLALYLLFASPLLIAQTTIQPNSTTFPGKVTVNDVFENNGMKYPLADGQNGQVLTTDGTGNLSWGAPVGGLGDYFTSFYEFKCDGTPVGFILGGPASTEADCGIIYDSGGPAGDYGNDEFLTFTIQEDPAGTAIYTRVILRSLDIDEAGTDNLRIGEDRVYDTDLTTPDTLLFEGNDAVGIVFFSDAANTGAGFEIYWDRYKPKGELPANDAPLGFFYDLEKKALGGGVELNNAWDSVGVRSILFGYGSSANGAGSISIGRESRAANFQSLAIGNGSRALGDNDVAVGLANRTSGTNSVALGEFNNSSGNSAVAVGTGNFVTGESASAFGSQLSVGVFQMTAVGSYNQGLAGSATAWVETDPVFVIGNGQDGLNRSNAMTVLKNGDTGIGTLTPAGKLDVAGEIWGQSFLVNSDPFLKQNIEPIEKAMDNIRQLKGVTYSIRRNSFEKSSIPQARQLGLIVQEVEQVLPELVKESREGYKAVNYNGLIPVLIEGMKEQQEIIEDQDEKIENLESQVMELKDLVEQFLDKGQQEGHGSNYVLSLEQKALLAQNQPNPFHQNTVIQYFIPADVQNAFIRVTTADGKVLGQVQIAEKGEGQLTIRANSYPAGTYYYSLVLDGQVLETKPMVLTR